MENGGDTKIHRSVAQQIWDERFERATAELRRQADGIEKVAESHTACRESMIDKLHKMETEFNQKITNLTIQLTI